MESNKKRGKKIDMNCFAYSSCFLSCSYTMRLVFWEIVTSCVLSLVTTP